MLDRKQAITWAERWVECWNDGDLDGLLSLHHDLAYLQLRGSPADAGTGSTPGERKEALRHYWAAEPCGIHSGRVDLERVLWDPDSRELAIVYAAQIDQMRMRGCDLITLDGDAKVLRGEACAGSLLDDVPLAAPAAVVSDDRHGAAAGHSAVVSWSAAIVATDRPVTTRDS